MSHQHSNPYTMQGACPRAALPTVHNSLTSCGAGSGYPLLCSTRAGGSANARLWSAWSSPHASRLHTPAPAPHTATIPHAGTAQVLLRTLSILFVVLFLSSCAKDSSIQIEDYYLPITEITDSGITYEYHSAANDSLPPYTWHFRRSPNTPNIIMGTYSDYAGQPQQFIREERVSNGMLLHQMLIYQADSTNQIQEIPVNILAGNAFPFQVRDSLGVFLYKVQWQSPLDNATITLIRNRRFLGKTTIEWEGKQVPAVEFRVRELIENDQEGVLSLELEGKEVYAQHIGLVYYEKQVIGSDFRQAYRLEARYE